MLEERERKKIQKTGSEEISHRGNPTKQQRKRRFNSLSVFEMLNVIT
jgi:hypothetical protein